MKLIWTAGIQMKWRCDHRSCTCNLNYNDHISISSVLPQFKSTSLHVSFLSRLKINSINWSALNIWVFIAQLVEHCRASRGHVFESGWSPEKFLGLKFAIAWIASDRKYNRDDHSSISSVFPQFKSTPFPVTGKGELDKLVCSQHTGLQSLVGRALQSELRPGTW